MRATGVAVTWAAISAVTVAAVLVPSAAFAGGGLPGAPVIGAATPGDSSAAVSFSAPSDDGGSAITSYTATCASSDGGATGIASDVGSPITVTGLTNESTYTCTVSAANDNGSGPDSDPTAAFSPFTVPGAPVIGTATAGNTAATVSFAAPSDDGGSPVTSYAATCASSNGGATGSANGTASPITVTGLSNGATYTCTVIASNAGGPGPASAPSNTFTLSANQPPLITSANSASFAVGVAGSFQITTTGGPVPAITKNGKLPTGLTFVDNHNGTATLAGTVPAGKGGSFPLTIIAKNNRGTATQAFSLVAGQPPSFKSLASVAFTAGSAGSFVVSTSGFPPPSLTEAGALPDGVTFADNGNGTATLSGTPVAGSGGSYPLALTASSVLGTANQSFTLSVYEGTEITSDAGYAFTVASSDSFVVTTAGFPVAVISKSGKLPTGVTFVDNRNGTATISGTPSAGKGGSYPLVITAKNSRGTATQAFALVVNQPPAFKSASFTAFQVGVFKSFTVTTTGYPPAALSEAEALPDGVAFVDNGNGTATLSGTPSPGTTNAYALTFTASSSSGTATQNFTLLIQQP